MRHVLIALLLVTGLLLSACASRRVVILGETELQYLKGSTRYTIPYAEIVRIEVDNGKCSFQCGYYIDVHRENGQIGIYQQVRPRETGKIPDLVEQLVRKAGLSGPEQKVLEPDDPRVIWVWTR